MILPVLAMLAGIVCLVWGADRFVEGAAALARRLGVSELVVGMVVVGFGTSAPELTVSALSAWRGTAGIALGNAFGSNIANITLILGAAALVNPMVVRPGVAGREIPSLILATLFASALVWLGDGVSRMDALLMLAFFAATLAFSMRGARSESAPEARDGSAGIATPSLRTAVLWSAAGLALLLAGSQSLVWGAATLARALGVGDLMIGLTVVAVGTSLPELASSVSAARKNRHDIAVGNVIGSNIFNTLAVVGVAGAIRPMAAEPALLHRDLPAMAAATAVLYLVCRGRRGGLPDRVSRPEGAVLLALFVLYTGWVVATSLA